MNRKEHYLPGKGQPVASELAYEPTAEGIELIRRTKSAPWGTLGRLVHNRGAAVGLALIGFLALCGILAPVLAPYGPTTISILERLQPPSLAHVLGTDQAGRDILSRLLFGTRLSLTLGLVSVGIGGTVGITVGLIAGFYGSWVDLIVMRFVDVLMAMPSILLALVMAFALGPSILNLMIAVGISQTPSYIRLVRGTVLSAKNELYVDAARALGCSNRRVMFRHVLPNVVAPAVVVCTLALGWAILSAASLSFLGLGVQPPTPEWGNMVSEGRARIQVAWWVSLFPGFAIMMAVLGLNLLGDGLRDVLDPRLKGR